MPTMDARPYKKQAKSTIATVLTTLTTAETTVATNAECQDYRAVGRFKGNLVITYTAVLFRQYHAVPDTVFVISFSSRPSDHQL
eukprot:SAG31_NODE_427_length_15813_cov_13.679649_14_plen_84_part_00